MSKQLYGLFQGEIEKSVTVRVDQELAKALTTSSKEQTYQMNVPPWMNYATNAQVKEKPEGRVSYISLRNFSIHYPIARACIDYLKTKIVKLNWSIVSEDPEDKLDPTDPRVKLVEAFFKKPLGKRSTHRNMIEAILEDYLVVGSFSLERIRTRGGQFLGEFKLVDSSTIQIKTDQYGRLPEPPEPSFRQVINGTVVTELTQDQLLYVTRGKRTSSPYGLSPLESIIIQAESALQSALYNNAYFKDGNVPEGFGEMPEGWTTKNIREFQDHFDAMMSGNMAQLRKIKMVPKGFNYQAVKKPEALGFDRFELWILQQTCSVFGVPPQDIGYNMQTNKANGEVQQELGEERGMKPLAQLLEGVFTQIITDDFGFEGLKFTYTDLDPTDAKMEAEVNEIKVRNGVLSPDEWRAQDGLEPIGLGHIIKKDMVTVEQLLNPPEVEAIETPKEEKPKIDADQEEDLKMWLKQSKNAFKQGRSFKKFQSVTLTEPTIDEIYGQLQQVSKSEDIQVVFEPYLNNTMKTLDVLESLSDALTKLSR